MAKANTAKKDKVSDEKIVVLNAGQDSDEPGNNGKVKKSKSGKSKKIIILLMLIFFVAAFAFVTMFFDLFGVRTGLFAFLHSLDPEYRNLEMYEVELDIKEANLDEREQKLIENEQKLVEREAALAKAEAELKTQGTQNVPIYRGIISDQDLADMKSISKIYASMPAESAAEIMASLYTVEDMAAIIYYMSESNAASILQVMEVWLAAQITDLLLH